MHITFGLGCVRAATSGFLAGHNVCGTYEHKRIVSNLVDLLSLGCERSLTAPSIVRALRFSTCRGAFRYECVSTWTLLHVCAHTQAADQHTDGERPDWQALWDMWDNRAEYRKTPRRNTGRV